MAHKRLSIDLNSYPKWSEINWINLEIETSVEALKRLINIQRNSFEKIEDDLQKKIKATERETSHLEEWASYQYVEHIHGIEERTTQELSRVIDISEIATVLSIFESKLKIITEKIIDQFGGNLPNESNSVLLKYWLFIKYFLGDEIGKVETYFTYINNCYVLRNVLIHQNSVAIGKQCPQIESLKSVESQSFEQGSLYVINIGYSFTDDLIKRLEKFFTELLKSLTVKTNTLI